MHHGDDVILGVSVSSLTRNLHTTDSMEELVELAGEVLVR